METGWPSDQILREAGVSESTGPRLSSDDGLDIAQFDKDLRSVLVEMSNNDPVRLLCCSLCIASFRA